MRRMRNNNLEIKIWGFSCLPQQEVGLWRGFCYPSPVTRVLFGSQGARGLVYLICITVSAQYTLQGTWVRVPIQLLHNKSKYRSFCTSKHEILDVGLRLDARKLVVQSVSLIYTGPNFSANRYGCLTKVH